MILQNIELFKNLIYEANLMTEFISASTFQHKINCYSTTNSRPIYPLYSAVVHTPEPNFSLAYSIICNFAEGCAYADVTKPTITKSP
jgi:hypothetical protein